MNLTNKQLLGIAAAILSGLVAGTAQLTDVFGPQVAKAIVSLASLGSMMLNSIIVGISGQGAIVQDVRSMTGVESIEINANANPTLAALAVDPKEDKIVPKASDLQQIAETAKT